MQPQLPESPTSGLARFDLPDATTLITFFAVVVTLIVADRILRRPKRVHRLHHDLIMIALTGCGLIVVIWTFDPAQRDAAFTLGGILISAIIALSSGTWIGNGMAGILLRVQRHFRAGDYIRVGDWAGRVTERGLFFTEIQNELRDLVTVPNSYLANRPTKVIRTPSTLICTEVSLGYDVSRSEVEQLLLDAAQAAGLADSFVHILALGDFAISYRVSGLLTDSQELLSGRSRLNAMVLDTLHAGGIEIVSPSFMNQRVLAPEQAMIPDATGRPLPTTRGTRPEAVMFDKAKAAAARERLAALVESVNAKVQQLKAEIERSTPESREDLTQRLERLEKRRTWLIDLIARQEEEV